MNYFFSVSNNILKTKLTIPQFRNDGMCDKSYRPFKASIKNKKWEISPAKHKYKNNFFLINENEMDNKSIFFLDKKNNMVLNNQKFFINELKDFNSYTDTIPEFRANLRIYSEDGGYSSYQSEYPFKMINKKGSIVSPISALTNLKADINLLFIKNIFYKPIKEKFNVFFVNLKNQKVVFKKTCFTNCTNEIEIDKTFITPDTYLFSENFICVPMFVSILNNQISFEHTHPPQLYLLSKEKFKIIANIKRKINEIIYS